MGSKSRYSIILFSILIIFLLAVSSKAEYSSDGWPVETRVNGTVNGGVFHNSIGWTVATTQTLVTDVPNGIIKYAYLYTGVWGNGISKDGWMNVTFNGDSTSNKLGPIHLEGESDSNDNVWCTGLGKHWLWYNVTNLVNAGQINTAITSKINGTLDGRVYGIVLVVVYEGGDNPKQIQYWINDGSDALSSSKSNGTTSFAGTVNIDNIAMANLTMVHLTGYDPSCDDCMQFNGNTLNTSVVNTNSFDMHTWNITNFMEASGNDAWFSRGTDSYVNICNAILTVEYKPDLVVSNIYPQYIFTNLTNVLSVNVLNQGTVSTASYDISLTITHTGGPTVLTATVPALNTSESAVVEVGNWKPTVLENISMTAFADNGGVVDEGTKEGNNNLTVSRNTTGDCTVDDMLPDTCYGYRGDNPMTTAYEGTGGVIYSVGDFKYKNNTVNFSIEASGDENQVDGLTAEVPTGATIRNATLYVYYTYRKSETGPNPGTDPGPDYEISINGGSTLTTDEYYTDIKGFSTSEYQYGTLVYNVTANVTWNGAYQAVRSNCNNTDPILKGKGYVSGMALMIIYDDGSDNTYAIAHGYDRLATYYQTQYKVLPEDATTTVTLTDVDPTTLAGVNLFTATIDALAPGSESEQFNTRTWEVGAWDCIAGVPTCDWNYPIGINRGAVNKSDITASGANEVVKFQERTSNGFAPVFACLQTRAPDLVVSSVYPQYIFTNLTNVLSVNVSNQGTVSTASCDISLTITHTGGSTVLTATVPALNTSESAVVEVGNWKPTVLENISMTAFADNGGVVDEGTKEGNNNLTVSRNTTGDCTVDDMLPDTCYGYRGDNPMTTAYEGTGGVIYSVGDFKYKNNTVNFSIEASGDENQVDGLTAEVPTGATIRNATLYVYYTYRKSETGPNPGTDPGPDYEISINGGSTLTTDEYYTDIKGFSTSEYQYGTLVYNVTANVTWNGAYQAVRSNCNNTDPILKGKGYVSGMALMIIYDDGSDNTYAIAHGYDRLATYYQTQYKVLPEDATTTVTLTDVNPTTIAEVNLFTATIDAVAPGSESQQFNSRSWEVGAWQCVAGVPSCNYLYPFGINRSEVDKNDITASGTDEVVKFQERTSNGFAPVFACLQTRAPDPTPPGNSGGGGGSSSRGGASGENYANIETSETEREYLNKGSKVTYNFDSEENIINCITFTPLSNFGKVAVKVEILKTTSSLADTDAPDEVFMNLNIWAGSSSWATSENIAGPEIEFEVERSWIKENSIIESTIKMYRFSDGEWEQLETTQTDKNEEYLSFKAKTSGFSPFAITGKTSTSVTGDKDTDTKPTGSKDDISTQIPGQTTSQEDTGSPGFGSIAGICMLLIAILILQRQKL
jgi:PGF-pre-PGF domain-containing protein